MTRTLVAFLVAVVVGATAATAGAKTYRSWTSCTSRLSPTAEISCATANLKHATDVIRFLAANPSVGRPLVRERIARNHRWLRSWALRRLAEARARLAPPVGHWALWSCITNGAYPGAPHEGDGYNGPYSGPLGMTTPWMNHMPPGSDWVHSDRAAVYAIAEREAAAHGFSDSWMRGQWPRTYPPCSGLA